MTECTCSEPGWCERHQCRKTPHWHYLCQTRPDYFRLWEAGRGPGQITVANMKPARRRPCLHQGSVRREEQCPSCRGEVLIKVFDCELHGQCTWARAIEEIVCCAKCADYAVPACDQNADQA